MISKELQALKELSDGRKILIHDAEEINQEYEYLSHQHDDLINGGPEQFYTKSNYKYPTQKHWTDFVYPQGIETLRKRVLNVFNVIFFIRTYIFFPLIAAYIILSTFNAYTHGLFITLYIIILFVVVNLESDDRDRVPIYDSDFYSVYGLKKGLGNLKGINYKLIIKHMFRRMSRAFKFVDKSKRKDLRLANITLIAICIFIALIFGTSGIVFILLFTILMITLFIPIWIVYYIFIQNTSIILTYFFVVGFKKMIGKGKLKQYETEESMRIKEKNKEIDKQNELALLDAKRELYRQDIAFSKKREVLSKKAYQIALKLKDNSSLILENQAIHDDFKSIFAIDKIYSYFYHGRVESMKEAINLFVHEMREDIFREEIYKYQEAILNEEKKQTSLLETSVYEQKVFQNEYLRIAQKQYIENKTFQKDMKLLINKNIDLAKSKLEQDRAHIRDVEKQLYSITVETRSVGNQLKSLSDKI